MLIQLLPGPPAGDNIPHLLLLRLPAAGQMDLAITCDAILHLNTHFLGRRTLPCLSHDCPGCAEGKPKRYEGYISAWTQAPSRHIILALTAPAARGIALALPVDANLRGRIFRISRNGKRPNGMLKVELQERTMPEETMPPSPDLLAHLYKIWGLDTNHIAADNPTYAQNVRDLSNKKSNGQHASLRTN